MAIFQPAGFASSGLKNASASHASRTQQLLEPAVDDCDLCAFHCIEISPTSVEESL